MKFFLIHQYSGNKGDRAVLYAMCRLIKALYSDSTISVATSDASLWNGYKYYTDNNIKFTPWSWDFENVSSNKKYWNILLKIKKYTFTIFRETFLRGLNISKFLSNPSFQKALKEADVVVSVGGHHFTTILSRDLVSGINYDAMSVLSMKKKLICFSQSFGPFKFYNKRNKMLTKVILSKCCLMPREDKSRYELHNMVGENNNMFPTYESVISLSKFSSYTPIEKRDNTIGIAIYCTQYRTDNEKNKYQKTIAKFCDYAIEQGFDIKFFPMEMKGSVPDDRPFIMNIISKVYHSDICSIIDEDLETLEHLKEVSKCKVFVGHKTHSTIFALATGTPLIGIAYHPKTIEFLRQFNVESNAIDDKELNIQKLCSIFDSVISNLDYISQIEYDKATKIAEIVYDDFRRAIESVI